MNRVLLCVDVSNQVYKAAAVHPTLQSEGRFTGGLYGFLTAVAKAIIFTKATDLVLCRDSSPYLRSKSYPEYKSIRASTKDEDLVLRAKETLIQVNELVAQLGLPMWEIPGFESDDLVAHAVSKYRNRFSKIVAASNDSDLFQLFRYRNFAVWKGKNGLYERSDYDKEWGLEPEEFILALAMTGTHNEVAGIAGVGPVTARAAVRSPEKLRSIRSKHAAIIDRNLGLIKLPHPEFPVEAPLPTMTKPFKDRALINFCARYDIDTTKAMLDAFNQLNRGK